MSRPASRRRLRSAASSSTAPRMRIRSSTRRSSSTRSRRSIDRTEARGREYGEFIRELHDHERARRAAHTARAAAIFTSSGALIALIATLGLWGSNGSRLEALPPVATIYGGLAVLAFLVAGVLGLLAGRLQEDLTVARPGLDAITRKLWWDDDEVTARGNIAQIRAVFTRKLRDGNDQKVVLIERASAFQLAGIGSLACAIAATLLEPFSEPVGKIATELILFAVRCK